MDENLVVDPSAKPTNTVRYGGQGWWPRLLSAYASALAIYFAVVIATGSWSSAAGLVCGVVMLLSLIVVTALAMVSASAWRKIVLTPTELVIPYGLGSVRIPINEIAGVGLVYRFWPAFTGWNALPSWVLCTWRADGSQVYSYCVSKRDKALENSRRGRPKQVDEEFVARTVQFSDWSRLAATRQGTVALDIYKRVAAIQGSQGPLLSRHLEKSVTWANADSSPLTLAYWSPDGDLGPAHWASEREYSENPPIGWANR